MPDYINHNGYTVHLTGPDGSVIKIRSRQKVTLPEYYDRYRIRGFIKYADESLNRAPSNKTIHSRYDIKNNRASDINKNSQDDRIDSNPSPLVDNSAQERRKRRREAEEALRKSRKAAMLKNVRTVSIKPTIVKHDRVVGRELKANPNVILKQNLEKHNYPISNGIGVGILSYNRHDSLKRCIDSILAYTDLTKTTIFVSDDASTDERTVSYLESLKQNGNLVIIMNQKRLGVAGNSNRLLRCLERFDYGILLNDDVQVTKEGWEHFYPKAMSVTGYHHYVQKHDGVYGTRSGSEVLVNNVRMKRIEEKPQGAVLAFTHQMLDTCGYFDESYGLYGMEHVDWSSRPFESGLQPHGFYDVDGSSEYFFLNKEDSAVSDRASLLKTAKEKYNNRKLIKSEPSDETKVPSISYIIPFRNTERTDSIITVVKNIRAQKFPVIDIYLVEQDHDTKIDVKACGPVRYHLVTASDNPLFNKSLAFNSAASKIAGGSVIMHDADILAPNFYTDTVFEILKTYEACHIGATVVYADESSTRKINESGVIPSDTNCERLVGYYEGGSLACRMRTYWRAGAFNQDFWGYGCEDCDFYARLASTSEWHEKRSIDFLHLYHGRVSGWDAHHKANKARDMQLRSMTMGDRLSLQYKQLREKGYGELLEEALRD